jgi:hypothetical protein
VRYIATDRENHAPDAPEPVFRVNPTKSKLIRLNPSDFFAADGFETLPCYHPEGFAFAAKGALFHTPARAGKGDKDI